MLPPPLSCLLARTSGRRRGNAQAAPLEGTDDGGNGGGAVFDAGAEQAPLERQLADADDLRHGRRRLAVGGFAQLDLDGVAAQLALELLGSSLDDDTAAVDDREPGGEPVGLLEVVGRE